MTENFGETRFAFFSAIQEDNPVEDIEEDAEEEVGKEKQEDEKVEPPKPIIEKVPLEADFSDPCEILSSERLIKLFRSFKRFDTEEMTVGKKITSN